ncbi:MAG: glycoside hydrolase family 92 protein, partial [Bacteroidetes bacterium]|nr:glycoside hydrolase family 92 protein [Bacteroidota bacterium]
MKYCQQVSILIIIIALRGAAFAGPDNIAPLATITVSTEASTTFAGRFVNDGIIGVDGKGEWACQASTAFWGYIRLPWVQLDWNTPQWVNKIVLFDRPSLKENITGAKIIFSDGSVE